ncbi:hypothetical protein GCM10010339_80880 [Streptomyces alanosinicus]|uniref:Uncharacterized protein n=1 Tax=Streptomyces alanosinicus TaxID=68171 RepID=A0A918YRV1_9ACTN|nr:hypothetical protein GCM10010339_80880 [Streptomyces alanosinicus]
MAATVWVMTSLTVCGVPYMVNSVRSVSVLPSPACASAAGVDRGHPALRAGRPASARPDPGGGQRLPHHARYAATAVGRVGKMRSAPTDSAKP